MMSMQVELFLMVNRCVEALSDLTEAHRFLVERYSQGLLDKSIHEAVSQYELEQRHQSRRRYGRSG